MDGVKLATAKKKKTNCANQTENNQTKHQNSQNQQNRNESILSTLGLEKVNKRTIFEETDCEIAGMAEPFTEEVNGYNHENIENKSGEFEEVLGNYEDHNEIYGGENYDGDNFGREVEEYDADQNLIEMNTDASVAELCVTNIKQEILDEEEIDEDDIPLIHLSKLPQFFTSVVCFPFKSARQWRRYVKFDI